MTLSQPASTPVVVTYTVDDGTATTADSDYVDGSSSVTIDAGETTEQINVAVNGDTKVEPDETFSVAIDSADATITDGTGTGTIQNDDVNHPPVLAPIGDQVVTAGAILVVPISASDDDDDALSFHGVNLSAFALLDDNGDGTAFLTLQPDDADIGVHNGVEIVVGDGTDTDSETIAITVAAPGNHRPFAKDDSGQTHGTAPAVIRVLANDTDRDGDTLVISDYDQHGGRVTCGGVCLYTRSAGFSGTGHVHLHDQ